MRKRTSHRARWCGLATVVLVVVLGTALAVQAEWYWTHGHSGRIQNEALLVNGPGESCPCYWREVEAAGLNSHSRDINGACPAGYYVTAIDIDRIDAHAMDSPGIGAIRCCPSGCPDWVRGWGLDFWLDDDSNTWVHFAVPTPASKTVRQIGLRFEAANGGKVVGVHIWNGNTQVKTLTVSYSGSQDVTLDLGSYFTFNRGLGISVHIESYWDDDGHFKFFGVGANFED